MAEDTTTLPDPVAALDVAFEGTLPASVDEAAVRRMATVARVLDDGFRIPGTDARIGIDPILGIVPGAGDAVAAGLSLYVVLEAARLGVSFGTLVTMLATIAADAALGSIPVVGVVIDAVFKANVRNLELALSDLVVDEREASGDDRDADSASPVVIEVTE
jgi:hypothetical protein